MSSILISFLGRTKQVDGAYQKVQYYFNSEKVHSPVAYVGYVLQEIIKYETFIILGTSGSMWDHLFESDLSFDDHFEEERLSLMSAVSQQNVTQEQLDKLAPLLSEKLNKKVILKIIPYARNSDEQIGILETINNLFSRIDNSDIYLDVTHGFRSLPMIAFAAVQYLNNVKPNLTVKNIFYGELSTKNDISVGYINELSGLLKLNDWNKAFYHSEVTGSYSLISNLMADDEPEISNLIDSASFYEGIHQIGKARGEFRKAEKLIVDKNFTGPAALFKPALLSKIHWVDENHSYKRQSIQAIKALGVSDFLRASLYGYEAYITKKMYEYGFSPTDIQDGQKRTHFSESLRNDKIFKKSKEGEDFNFLRRLRNAIAHGESSDIGDIQSAAHNSTELKNNLQKT